MTSQKERGGREIQKYVAGGRQCGICVPESTRIHPQLSLRGRWRPACFWSLLGRNPGSGRGGVPVSFKMFKNSIGFFIQDSISALQTHKIFKNIKVGPDGQTDIRHLDPVLDHFGAATVAIPEIFGFRPKLQL